MSSVNQIGLLRRLNAESLLEGRIPDTIPLQQGRYIVGRGSQADHLLSAQKDGKFIISRQHAALMCDGGKCSIEDVGALNGIFVNGVRIKTKVLAHGDVVQFGGMSDALVGQQYDAETTDVAVRYKCELFQAQSKPSVSKEVVKKSVEKPSNVAASKKRSRTSGLDSDSDIERHVQAKVQESKSEAISISKEETVDKEEISPLKKKKRMSNAAPSVQNTPQQLSSSFVASKLIDNGEHALSIPSKATTEKPALLEDKNFDGLEQFRDQTNQAVADLKLKYAYLETIVQKFVVAEAVSSKDNAAHNNEIQSLQKEIARLQEEKAAFKTKQDELEAQLAKTASNNGNTTANEKSHIIDIGEVKSKYLKEFSDPMTCILCKELFVLPVTLKCSHSFCWECTERHLSRKVSTCPICFNAPPSEEFQHKKGKKSKHLNNVYVRSDTIDNVVYQLVENLSKQQQEVSINEISLVSGFIDICMDF